MHHPIKDQITVEIKSLIYSYPKFILSRNNGMNLDGIPVFIFHTIDPEIFESQLIYLKTNGYKTLSIDEFYEVLINPKSSNLKRSVLLTIDDARSSVWKYAYPLLKKYEMKATVFVVPGWTKDEKVYRNNLFDAWEGRCNFDELDYLDPDDSTLCTWQELREMYSSGLINIESHTLFHREVFRNTNIIDFFSPESIMDLHWFSASPYLKISDIGRDIKAEDYSGLPLFQTTPLMLGGPILNVSDEFIALCKEMYNQNVSWKNEIKKMLNEPSEIKKYFDFEAESKKNIREDLQIAKSLIKEKIDQSAGNHLCFPWTIGSDEAINIAKELEIKTCFLGVQSNKRGDDPCHISRIKNDFIFRLPGKDRKSLFSIYSYKFQRRLKNERVF